MKNPYETIFDEETRYFIAKDKECFLGFDNHVSENYPCVFAKSIFKRNNYVFSVYTSIFAKDSLKALCCDLLKFRYDQDILFKGEFSTFIAIFRDDFHEKSEEDFERVLWNVIGFLVDNDSKYFDWDVSVSSDPNAGDFSFSFGERAYFLVGMNPRSIRLSRAFKYPAIVFNARKYFDRLRDIGAMQKYRELIRKRDVDFQGFINENLIGYGDSDSEAKLYSGKVVSNAWICPLVHQKTNKAN